MSHFWGPQSPYKWVHFWWNVLRNGSYILSSSLQLGSKQPISSDFGNQRYLIGVIDTGCIYGVMRLPPGDYCSGWLGMGDDKILGGGPYRWGSMGINPLDMGLFWSLNHLPSRWVGFGVHQWHTPIKIWSSAPPGINLLCIFVCKVNIWTAYRQQHSFLTHKLILLGTSPCSTHMCLGVLRCAPKRTHAPEHMHLHVHTKWSSSYNLGAVHFPYYGVGSTNTPCVPVLWLNVRQATVFYIFLYTLHNVVLGLVRNNKSQKPQAPQS